MDIAKKCSKTLVFGKTAFLGSKNDIYPKTKVVPNTLSNYKTNKNMIFFKKIIFGGVRGPQIRCFLPFFAIFGGLEIPPKLKYIVIFFIHETNNS